MPRAIGCCWSAITSRRRKQEGTVAEVCAAPLRGWLLDVLTLSSDDLAEVDRARLEDVSEDVRVFTV